MKPKPHHRVICKECGKKRFASMIHAEIRIESFNNPYPLYSYECEYCGDWHITKQPNFKSILEMNLLK